MYKTLLVTDEPIEAGCDDGLEKISFQSYLKDYPKLNEPRIRLINLCNTEKYLSRGYYCSLLAESRNHLVFPSVRTINDMRGGARTLTAQQLELNNKDLAALAPLLSGNFLVFMGSAEIPELQKIATKVFRRYTVPILEIGYELDSGEITIKRASFSDLSASQQAKFFNIIEKKGPYTRSSGRKKELRWDMAILVNDQEPVPPSNKRAIGKFVKAAEKLGIRASVLNADQLLDINHFDALFIRETTAINHHSYRLACEAEANGLIVIDDPDSILRCCNKVFLHDAFSYKKIPSLQTEIVSDNSQATHLALEALFDYPMVLKMPEGSFSLGVFKACNRAELRANLALLLQGSALVLVQEYLYTDYDWRIGVLNGRPLYACRYYMAPNHWQIYNPQSKRNFSGGFETLATYEVPKEVLDIALRACKLVGNGLYGVDIKVSHDKAYVIEVNDNPSIEHKVEDAWLGEELYMQIMSEFHRRLELRGR